MKEGRRGEVACLALRASAAFSRNGITNDDGLPHCFFPSQTPGHQRASTIVNWIIYLLAALAGAANPGQSAANAELNKRLGNLYISTAFVYGTGLIGVLILAVCVHRSLPAADKFAAVPWWAWTGGLLSIGATLAGAAFAQRLGSGVFTGITVTAAIVISIVLDHFGWMGLKQHPATALRILGSLLMIVGLWLTAKF